ncbi:MAG: Rrf2 family transcriptional regulator [Bacteroidetes bacterium]|nr:Rrf2 family transcriptional regulator [Bacteroidota bacterium]
MAKIVNITEAVTIALHSAVLITKEEGRHVNVNFIANATGSSKFHIAKVLQKLVKDGFLGSTRGPSGGFYLIDNPEDITLLQLYESIEGKIVVSKCPLNKATCPFGNCVFDDLTMDMTKNFKDYLESRTLADYLKKETL